MRPRGQAPRPPAPGPPRPGPFRKAGARRPSSSHGRKAKENVSQVPGRGAGRPLAVVASSHPRERHHPPRFSGAGNGGGDLSRGGPRGHGGHQAVPSSSERGGASPPRETNVTARARTVYLQKVPRRQEQRRVRLLGLGALLGQRRQRLQAQLANLRAHPDREGQRANRVRVRGRPRASGGPVALHHGLRQTLGKSPACYELGTS